MGRKLAYEPEVLWETESRGISNEFTSHIECLYHLKFKDAPEYRGDGIKYTPNVQFPFVVWFKDSEDKWWSAYHVMCHFLNSKMNFDDVALRLNSVKGKTWFLKKVLNEIEVKDKALHKELTSVERNLRTSICKYLQYNEGTFKVMPLVLNAERNFLINNKNKYTLDRRFTLESKDFRRTGRGTLGVMGGHKKENITADLYSFAVFYESDKTTWFYNLFWDDNFGQDTDEVKDRLLNDEDGEVWEQFCAYNELVPDFLLDVAAGNIGHVQGVFPVYIDTAVIVDVTNLNMVTSL